jgi:uncharacterized protein (DUF305 family)
VPSAIRNRWGALGVVLVSVAWLVAPLFSSQGAAEATDGTGGTAPEADATLSEMLLKDGQYSDEAFIDAMALHHQGAIDMANVCLAHAEHEEAKALCYSISANQQDEIQTLRMIKQEEYGTSDIPTQASSEEMAMMGMMKNPQELANQQPFDKAFIDAMIPHHQAAIEMAEVAQQESTNPRIRDVARSIIAAQKADIAQMTQWRRQWYPESTLTSLFETSTETAGASSVMWVSAAAALISGSVLALLGARFRENKKDSSV